MTNPPGDDGTPQQPEQPISGPEQPPGQQYGQQYGHPQDQQYTQPYEQQPGQAYPPYAQPAYQQGVPSGYYPQQDHPKATTALVLGILGLVVCGVLAPFAWQMGRRTMEEIDASQGRLGGRGAAQAGYVMGIIGTILLGLGLLLVVVWVVFFVVLAGGTMLSSQGGVA